MILDPVISLSQPHLLSLRMKITIFCVWMSKWLSGNLEYHTYRAFNSMMRWSWGFCQYRYDKLKEQNGVLRDNRTYLVAFSWHQLLPFLPRRPSFSLNRWRGRACANGEDRETLPAVIPDIYWRRTYVVFRSSENPQNSTNHLQRRNIGLTPKMKTLITLSLVV